MEMVELKFDQVLRDWLAPDDELWWRGVNHFFEGDDTGKF